MTGKDRYNDLKLRPPASICVTLRATSRDDKVRGPCEVADAVTALTSHPEALAGNLQQLIYPIALKEMSYSISSTKEK